MKFKEFKRAISNIGLQYGMDFEVKMYSNVPYIVSGDEIYACVSKTERYMLDTNYLRFSELKEDIREDLLKVMYKFAITPPKDREDEKRYIIPLPHLVTTDGEQQYLTHQNGFFACRRDKNLRQTWKEKDLKHIPEEYRKYAVEVEE
ncbi:MAG: hypothetical protein KHZ82_02505 [Peptoniphilus harei]|nr:hypothetical protein [Peptoniphilus harei]